MFVCGHAGPLDGPEGLCAQCLLGLAGESKPPERVGTFRILGVLGKGGFGCVYRAQRDGTSDVVALKVLRDFVLADSACVERFRREPTLSAKLDPRYVVKVLEAGDHEGQPYFVMEYLPGDTLRKRMDHYRASPERAAELMLQIAEAVQYLHRDPHHPDREAILHRDLKPENILFGADGRPRISDFGIAKLAGASGAWSETLRLGCPAYMAPEQYLGPRGRELTAAVDVYALGVILYELFTGRVPFDGDKDQILAGVRDREPSPPRRFVPELDRFLETVVLNALEKDPARRYDSALAFAQDLERALRQEPPRAAPPVPAPARLWAWVRRRPLTSAFGLWALSLGCVVSLSAYSTVTSRSQSVERDQQLNASIAGMQAVAVNLQLQSYKQRILSIAEDPAVVGLVSSVTASEPSPVLIRYLDPFDSVFVLATDGKQRARTTSKSREYLERAFEFRDYFRGARRLGCEGGQGAYVARAFVSESDGHFQFAVSAPLCSGSTWVGVVAGTVATDKVLGAVQLLDDRNGRISTVIGPRDRERSQANAPLPASPTFMVHPGLPPDQVLTLHEPSADTLRVGLGVDLREEDVTNRRRLRYSTPLRVDSYRDPVSGFEGTWAAVFAAADASGYVVAVQSRRETTPLGTALVQQLWLPAGVPFAASLLGLGLVGWTLRRRGVL